jgi:hypothetical protein
MAVSVWRGSSALRIVKVVVTNFHPVGTVHSWIQPTVDGKYF